VAKDDDNNRTTVQIYGQEYRIVGAQGATHVHKVAKIVDQKMREIKQKSAALDAKQLAVLTAVNIVSEHLQLQEDYNRLLQKQKKED
jgi:cell division protein ZapA